MKRVIFAGMVLCFFVLCKGPTESGGCTPIADTTKEMELVAPVSGSFNVGSSVEVAWKVNPKEVDQVVVQVSTTGSVGPWRNVFKGGIPVVPRDVELACMDTVWVVGQEYDVVDYGATSTVNLRVAWYNHEGDSYDWARDMSSMITIVK